MPSHIPRTDTTKKEIQLSHREHELKHALHSRFTREKLVKAAEKLRTAHLSLLKAKLYWAEDARLQGRDVTAHLAKIHDEKREWMERSTEEILRDFKI